MIVTVKSIDVIEKYMYRLALEVDGKPMHFPITLSKDFPVAIEAERPFWAAFLGRPPIASELLQLVGRHHNGQKLVFPIRVLSHDEIPLEGLLREYKWLLAELASIRASSSFGSPGEAMREAKLRALAARLPKDEVEEAQRNIEDSNFLGVERNPWQEPSRAPRRSVAA